MRRSMASWTVLLGAALLACACDEKKAADTHVDVDAATDKFVNADPKLERALKAAAAASANNDEGPPPGGVFQAGVADHRHPKSAPTKVDLIAEGSEPRIALSTPPADAAPANPVAPLVGPAVMELAMQIGPRSALPTVDFGLTIAPAKKDEGGDGWLVATVRHAAPAKEQFGQLPPGIDKAIATLQGTEIRMPFGPSAPVSDVQTALPKGAPSELERLALNAAETLVFDTVPYPPKPVGVGAQWIAETRMAWAGVDVIAYRAYRVKKIDGSRAELSIDVKGYSTEKEPSLPGLPKGATLEEFDAEAQGELDVAAGEGLARRGSLQERIAMLFQTPGAPGQDEARPGEPPGQPQQNMGSFQSQAVATFARGDEVRAAAR